MKAIITDLDKTLLRSDRTISKYTEKIFHDCRDKGILIVAATARPERSLKTYQAQMCFDAAATLNGAKIILKDQICENTIPQASGEKILSGLLEMPDVMISVEMEAGIYANVDRPEWRSMFFGGFPRLPAEGPLYKILVSREREPVFAREQIESILTEDTYCTVANGTLYQIMSKDATKWKGVQRVLQAFDISAAEAVYFGDDNDDLEPLLHCGMGVAVANANPDILSKVQYVAQSNDSDGVAHFIEEYILRK